MIDDADPEDAWSDDDPPAEQVANLRRRLALLFDADRELGDLADELDTITAAVHAVAQRPLNPRERLRADQIIEDVACVRVRL